MFGKEKHLNNFEPIILEKKTKKEIETMFQLLKDAHKYDNAEEYDVRNGILKVLCEHISLFINND